MTGDGWPRWLVAMAPIASLAVLIACGAPTPTAPAAATQTAAVAITQISSTAAAVSTVVGTVTDIRQTQVAPTTQAGATQSVATIQAVATRVDATPPLVSGTISPALQALATQAAGTAGPAMATAIAASPVQIVEVRLDQPDTRVVLRNSGATIADVGGWTMLFTAFGAIIPRNTLVLPGGSVTVHFAPGVSTATDVYLGTGPEVMADSLKPGNRIVLVTPQGQVASVYRIS
jgi:hypothetical protein